MEYGISDITLNIDGQSVAITGPGEGFYYKDSSTSHDRVYQVNYNDQEGNVGVWQENLTVVINATPNPQTLKVGALGSHSASGPWTPLSSIWYPSSEAFDIWYGGYFKVSYVWYAEDAYGEAGVYDSFIGDDFNLNTTYRIYTTSTDTQIIDPGNSYPLPTGGAFTMLGLSGYFSGFWWCIIKDSADFKYKDQYSQTFIDAKVDGVWSHDDVGLSMPTYTFKNTSSHTVQFIARKISGNRRSPTYGDTIWQSSSISPNGEYSNSIPNEPCIITAQLLSP